MPLPFIQAYSLVDKEGPQKIFKRALSSKEKFRNLNDNLRPSIREMKDIFSMHIKDAHFILFDVL